MVWPRSLPKYYNHWLASPHTTSPAPRLCGTSQADQTGTWECLSSYNVSALFTSVPIDPALNIIKDLLEKDTTLKERTVMEVGDIILLLEFCLKNTCFLSKASSMNRLKVLPWVSPVSPIVANLYMEYLEQKALSTAPHPLCSGTGCRWRICHPQGSQ